MALARLRGLARGGQTVVSAATRELAREDLPQTLAFRDLGEQQLRDMSGTERVYEVISSGSLKMPLEPQSASGDGAVAG
jgi:class 3 adenylate cyclase